MIIIHFRFLLQKANASVDTTDDDGDTALHYAAFGRQAAAMEYLLLPSFQANINAVNIKKCSVLHVSVVMQDIQAVEIILRQENVEVMTSGFKTTGINLIFNISITLVMF
jgi:E3 ubiquitin-protein ligase mind-bomb